MKARRAGVYVRASLDRSGEGNSVQRQETLSRQKAKSLGWEVVGVYRDNDISASTGRRRPEYERMLADVRSGHINAIVARHEDRLTRRPVENEALIEIADKYNVALSTAESEVDLATEAGRLHFRIMGSVARFEVERKGSRQRAANDQRASRGLPYSGRRAFGYEDDGITPNPVEAAALKAAVASLLAGGTVRGAATTLNRSGVLTTTGKLWKNTELRRVVSSPRYAGFRVHRGEVVGRAVWPPLISEDDHSAVVALLSDPSRRAVGRPRRYLLSGVGRCGQCGARLYGRHEQRGSIYVCESGSHVVRRCAPVDEYVEAVVLERLRRPDARDMFTRPDRRDEAAALRAEVATLTGRLDSLATAFAEGAISMAQLTTGSVRLRERLDAVQARIPSTQTTPVTTLAAAEDVDSTWEAMPVEARREVVGLLLDVAVHPAGQGARWFNPETVRLVWKGTE